MAFELVPIQPEINIQGFHSIYYFELDKHFSHLPEKHNFWELVYVDYGSVNAIVDGAGCALTKGQVIFHQPMELHSHIANQQNASNVVVISFSCDSPAMSFFNRKIFSLGKSGQKILSLFLAEATNALGQLCGDYNNKSPLDFSKAKPGAVQLMQCYLVELLFSLIRSEEGSVEAVKTTQESRRLAESSLVDSVQQYIQAQLRLTPSLPLLCREFSVSRTYLCGIFRECTNTSPVDYWISLKIRKAKLLIREENWNITQIAEYLGYSSIHHFSRMFKKVAGMSPSDYRKSVNE